MGRLRSISPLNANGSNGWFADLRQLSVVALSRHNFCLLERGVGMRRRNFMTVLAGAAAYPLSAGAQQKAMPVIGILSLNSPGPNAPNVASFRQGFRQGLSETGWVEGQNVVIEFLGAEGALIGCRHWPPISSTARST